MSKRLGIAEGTVLPRSIVEYYYKNDELGDPLVSEEHITAFGWAMPQDIDDMLSLSLRVNDFLSGLRSEEHTSELQSLMRISYAVFCLKKKNTRINRL